MICSLLLYKLFGRNINSKTSTILHHAFSPILFCSSKKSTTNQEVEIFHIKVVLNGSFWSPRRTSWRLWRTWIWATTTWWTSPGRPSPCWWASTPSAWTTTWSRASLRESSPTCTNWPGLCLCSCSRHLIINLSEFILRQSSEHLYFAESCRY